MEQHESADASLHNDDVLLHRIDASKSKRRLTRVGLTLSLLLIIGALTLLFLSLPQRATSLGRSIPEHPEQLTALINQLELKLQKPGRAADYAHLAAAYRKRFDISGNPHDHQQALIANEKFTTLMKKNPSKEPFMKFSAALFPFTFVVLIIGIVGLIMMLMHNGLVSRDEAVDAHWSQVETQLQRRLDLVPQLVETVKGYATHEKETLINVTRARTQLANILQQTEAKAPSDDKLSKQISAASTALGQELKALLVMVERYPDLQASQNFIGLQDQLEGTENRVATERRRYNHAVRSLNTRLRAFPHNVVAGIFGFEARMYFESNVAAIEPVQVKF
jgi:LemA protein